MRSALLVAKLTFRESIKNRWVISFSIGFAILSFLFSIVGSSETELTSNFNQTSAMILNILMLFIPLLGFTLGAQTVAGDREGGSLLYLLSHPISKNEYFFGKFIGSIWALITAITAGLGLAALGAGIGGASNFLSFIILWINSLLFIIVCTSVGMIVSVFSSNRGRSVGTALFAWLAFTVLSDLGLMATAQILRLRSEGILGLALFNPLEVFKILSIRLLSSNLEVLGKGGIYLDMIFGANLPLMLITWLIIISLVGLACANWVFRRQEEF
jgi:Cu-processing system permease protein